MSGGDTAGEEEIIATLRPFASEDLGAILELSIRAWEPVFHSIEQQLGSELFRRMHPDWRADQRRTVEEACGSPDVTVWVAESGHAPVGFVGIKTDDPNISARSTSSRWILRISAPVSAWR